MSKRVLSNLSNKVISIIIAAIMIISCMMPNGIVMIKADQTPVQYENYNEANKSFETESCTDYRIISGNNDADITTEITGWYVVDGNVEISGLIEVVGSANLILKDGCKLTASKGINVATGSALTIYGQGGINGENAVPGELICLGEYDQAGIGGEYGEFTGDIIINGGKIKSTGGDYGAGIGGGCEGLGTSIIINGGIVEANGGKDAPGIGGATGYGIASITINGGIVTANGGENAPGIGGGSEGDEIIEINGGEVEANSGGGGSAGIGAAGSNSGVTRVTINGGKVKAKGSDEWGGLGIGGGHLGTTIIVRGGMIEAIGGEKDSFRGAGIGSVIPDAIYNLDSGLQCFVSMDENSGYEDVSEDVSDSGSFGRQRRYVIVYKKHSGFLSASGSVVTTKCINRNGYRQSIDMEIKPPTEIVFGDEDSTKAVLEGVDDFNAELGRTEEEKVSVSQIKYYDGNGQLLSKAPTAKGSYTAKITVDSVTASVDYQITKEDPVIAAPIATGYTYTGDDQSLITRGSVTGGTLKYSLSENGPFSTDIPKGKDAGPYTVYYKVDGDNDYKDSVKYSVSAQINRASLDLSLTQEGRVKGSAASDPVLTGNEGNGDVTYEYKKKSDDDNAYVNAVPTEPGDYVVRATVAETQNYFGGTATAEFTITEPEPDPNTTTAPVIVYQPVYYPEEPKTVEKKNDGLTTTTEVKNPDGSISEISVTKLTDGSVTRETVRDKEGNVEYEYTRTKDNGTTLVQTINERADGSKKETYVTTTKSGTVSTKVKELTADGTVISGEGKSYADGRTSLKEAITGSDGVTKVVTEKSDAAGNVVWAEYTSIKDDANILLTTAEVTGTTLKLPDEIWVNEQYFVVAEIGKNALKNNKTVTKLAIGENVTSIGDSAFRNMKKLKSITINAANLESIGKNAFKGVGDKKRVTISVKAETEEEFEKICDMIRAAGAGKKVKFVKI